MCIKNAKENLPTRQFIHTDLFSFNRKQILIPVSNIIVLAEARFDSCKFVKIKYISKHFGNPSER
jgi:hypothetical protein